MDYLRIGASRIPLAIARAWVSKYFDEATNQVSTKPYAYPFYDQLRTSSGVSELNDGDLLAPALLNVPLSITAFRSLQSVRERLESGLSQIHLTLSLEDAGAQGSHRALLAGLFAVLDGGTLLGVKLTTLSKVLHRKRPDFVPLYDSQVRACYVGLLADHPISETAFKAMQWSGVVSALAECIVRDITTQAEIWTELAAGIAVSKLRVLDLVAWTAGGQLRSSGAEFAAPTAGLIAKTLG